MSLYREQYSAYGDVGGNGYLNWGRSHGLGTLMSLFSYKCHRGFANAIAETRKPETLELYRNNFCLLNKTNYSNKKKAWANKIYNIVNIVDFNFYFLLFRCAIYPEKP